MTFVRLSEAARLSGIPERTLRRLANDGQVRSVKISARRTLVHLQDACDRKTGVARLADLTFGRYDPVC